MRKLMNEHAALVLVTVAIAIAVMAAPSLAGTVFSWTTEDGTTAFTDDPKRIPAKYKNKVEKRQLGTLKNYKQYSESKVKHDAPYEQRIERRLGRMRGGDLPAVSAGPPGEAPGTRYSVGIGAVNNDQISFPVNRSGDGGGAASNEPFVTSEHRIRTRKSIASQDVTVTKQGDEVVSVRISAPNQRSVSERGIDYGAGANSR